MERTLSSVPSSVTAVSAWNGYEGGYNEMRYTAPSVGGGRAVFTLPEELYGAGFESAHLSYNAAGGSGTVNARYDGSAVSVTDANLLERLRGGEREIAVYFTFRASGGTGGEGSHSASYTWNNISLSIAYVPAGGVSGETAAGGHGIRYFCAAASLAPGETARMTISTDASVTAAKLYLGRGVYETAVTGGSGAFDLMLSQDEIDAMTERTRQTRLRFMLTDASGEVTSPTVETAFTLVRERLAPSVSVTFSDAEGHDAVFGNFIAGQSRLTACVTAALDTDADENIGIIDRTFTLNGVPLSAAAEEIGIGPVNESGSVPWTASVTDSYGVTGAASGSITLLPYAAPSVTAFEAQRCAVSYDGNGDPVLTADDGSPFVWLTLRGNVAPVAGRNAWSADLVFTGGGRTVTLSSVLSGEDGDEINVTRNTMLTEDVSLDVTQSHTASLVITDCFGTYSFTAPVIPAGGGILNIEPTGVAVGMRSTGSRARPVFETAYPAVFRGAVSFPGDDSLWQDAQTSGIAAGGTLKWRKRLGQVHLKGRFNLSSILSSGAAGSSAGKVKIGSLPEDCFSEDLAFPLVLDKSNGALRLLLIGGDLYLENRSGYAVGTGTEIALYASWLTD